MRTAKLKGISFGLTSGIITTLGLIVGLHSGTDSVLIVIAGIISIAFADAFSDALGIHISTESEKKYSHKEVWQATSYTFITKFLFAIMFIIPFLIFTLETAVKVCVFVGLFIMILFNIYIAKRERKNAFMVVKEHLLIAIVVIIIAHYVGHLANFIMSLA
jgi:VIT1/CCC1 family predicted Fe2+/Mn2+ transporter